MYDTIVTALGSACLILAIFAIGGLAINMILRYRQEYFAAGLFWVWLLVKYRRAKHTRRDVDQLHTLALEEIEKRDESHDGQYYCDCPKCGWGGVCFPGSLCGECGEAGVEPSDRSE